MASEWLSRSNAVDARKRPNISKSFKSNFLNASYNLKLFSETYYFLSSIPCEEFVRLPIPPLTRISLGSHWCVYDDIMMNIHQKISRIEAKLSFSVISEVKWVWNKFYCYLAFERARVSTVISANPLRLPAIAIGGRGNNFVYIRHTMLRGHYLAWVVWERRRERESVRARE